VSFLQNLVDRVKKESQGAIRRFELFEKKDDLVASAQEFLNMVKKELPEKPRIGMIKREPQKGKYPDAMEQAMVSLIPEGDFADISDMIAEVLSIKRPHDIPYFEKCGKFVADCFKDFVKNLEESAQSDRTITMNTFSDELYDGYEKNSRKYIKTLEMEEDFSYSVTQPFVQSGGNFSFKTNSVSSGDRLLYNCVILTFAGSYFDYKCIATRTYLFGSTKSDEDDYKIMYARLT
jgi:nucleosome binding factor SPN SPT16 subunit